VLAAAACVGSVAHIKQCRRQRGRHHRAFADRGASQERSSLQDRAEKCIVDSYGSDRLVLESGSGSYVYDIDGREYLDFTAGIAVNCLGHSHEGWAEAIDTQARKLAHTGNLFISVPQVDLAEKLVNASFADKVFFCNSGTEANEAALKFARKSHFEQGAPRQHFVAFNNAFHGRTMGALSLTWKQKYKAAFAPLLDSTTFLTFNSIEGLEAIDTSTCAVFVEPVQGEGGVIPASTEFLQALRKRCNEVGALLVFDEVQCGLGRTGHLFAYELKGVVPDMLTLAKPLAGGMPVGAVLVSDKIARHIRPGDHGSTFAGSPLVCAAANFTLDVLSDTEFLTRVSQRGAFLKDGLTKMFASRGDVAVRGEGLLVGVVFPEAEECTKIQQYSQEAGLLVLTAGKGNVMRLTPPLTVTHEEVEAFMELLRLVLRRIKAES